MGNSSSSKARKHSKAAQQNQQARRESKAKRTSAVSAASDNPLFTNKEEDVIAVLDRRSTLGGGDGRTSGPRPSFNGSVPSGFSQPPPSFTPNKSFASEAEVKEEDPETAQKRTLVRDQLTAFYYDIDPQRLMTGKIDVEGIVDWAINGPNGYIELNKMLRNKYGEDLLTHKSSQDPNNKSAKAAPVVVETHSTPRQDPQSQVAQQIPDVQVKKGKKATRKASKARPISMIPTAMVSQNQPPQPTPAEGDLVDFEEEEDILSDVELAEEIAKFLMKHDPGALDNGVQLQLLEFGIEYGLEFLNGRLMLKYGAQIDRTEGKRERLFADKDAYVHAVGVQAAPSSVLSEMSHFKLKQRTSTNAPANLGGHRGSNVDSSLERKWARRNTGLDEVDVVAKGDSACDDYRIDVSAKTFGVCKCGFAKEAHGAGAPKPATTMLPKKPSIVSADVPAFMLPKSVAAPKPPAPKAPKPPAPVQKPKPPAPKGSKAPAKSEQSKTAALENVSKVSDTGVTSTETATKAMDVEESVPKPKACDHYTINLSPEGFGLCTCGFAKSEHDVKARSKAKASKTKKPTQAGQENVENSNKTQDDPDLPDLLKF